MQPGGVIEIPKEVIMDEAGMKRLRDEIEQKHQGWSNAQKTLILDQGMTFNQSSIDPQAGQFLDTRKFSVFDVCRWFGVPPYLAFASDEEPRANVETQSREFLQYGLDPHIVSLVQEANRKLFFGFRGPLETHMDVSEFEQGDLEARGEFYTKLRHLGLFSVNDILKMEGLDQIGPEGDHRVMQVQSQPIDASGTPTAPKTGEPGAAGVVDPQKTNGVDKTDGATP